MEKRNGSFTLREGVTFPRREEIDSADVVILGQPREVSEDLELQGTSVPRSAKLRAAGPYTVEYRPPTDPTPLLPNNLTQHLD